MFRKIIAVAAWAVLFYICFVTLSPIALRPTTGHVGPERFLAYGLLGALFVMAYPRRFVGVASFIIFIAVGLEAMQHLTPDRHGHVADAVQKATGGFVGCCIGRLADIIFRERFRAER
jgi:VanZ family protein